MFTVRPLARSATRGVLARYALGIGGGDFGITRVCQLKIPKSRSRPSPRAFFACGLHNNYVVTQNGFTADFNSLMSPFV